MLKNYFKIAWRNLLRYKVYSAINIAGLAVGLACFFLIMVYVTIELNYDTSFQDSDRIYRIYSELETPNSTQTTAQSAPGWARYLSTDFPEIELVTRIKPPQQTWKVEFEDRIFYESGWTFADSTVVDMFDIQVENGDAKSLARPFTVFLSSSMAQKYFKDEDPIGKTFKLDNQYDFEVSGVFQDMPSDLHFRLEFLASFITLREPIYGGDLLQIDNFPISYTYVKLFEDTDPQALENKLPELVSQYIGSPEDLAQQGLKISAFVQPVTDIHLHSSMENEIMPNGQISTVYIFLAIAFFIISIAGINFVNLSTARSVRRAREVGLRKAIGATRNQLISQFLGEALLIAFLAMMLAILLIILILPMFSSMLGKSLSLLSLINPLSILLFVSITLLIGLISGIYPAVIISSYKTTETLKGNLNGGSRNGGFFRKVLIVFQFSVSILLIISTGIIYRQLNYINDFDLGLKQEQILVVQLTDPVLRNFYRPFKNAVQQIPTVNNVSASLSSPADVVNQAAFRKMSDPSEESRLVHFIGVDFDFINTLGISLVSGRDLIPENAADTLTNILINETAVKTFGWENVEAAIGEQLIFAGDNANAQPSTIVGVVRDFHMQSVHETISPAIISYVNVQGLFHTYIDIGEDLNGTLRAVEQVWANTMPNYPFEYSFLDEKFNRLYTNEATLGKLLTYFAGLAIFIACLGLFGLASFMVEQRRKEIGIRKVLGASEVKLMIMLSNEYTLLIVLAFIISGPVAYFSMDLWLQTFEYQVEIQLITFALSLLFALLISWITVSYKSLRAATENPVNSIRAE